MEQSISILPEYTNQLYRTTKAALKKLGFASKTIKMAKAQAFRFLVENRLNGIFACGEEFQRNQKRYLKKTSLPLNYLQIYDFAAKITHPIGYNRNQV
jgi:hypothetical protein